MNDFRVKQTEKLVHQRHWSRFDVADHILSKDV